MAQRPTAKVVPIFGDDDAYEEEIVIGSPAPAAAIEVKPVEAIDLSGRPKILFAIGTGGSGKTTLMRWMVEAMSARGSAARLAAIDPVNRDLRDYYEGVLEPATRDPAGIASWLQKLLESSVSGRASTLIDTGGGDASLAKIVSQTSDIVALMEDAGISPVAIYPLSPRVSDLTPLKTMEDLGFQPKATLIVLNEGTADPTVPREQSFRRILQHSVYRSAIDRGAISLWMPRLFVAAEIEGRRLTYKQARDRTVPDGRRVAPFGPFQASSVHKWLIQMDAAFAPVMSWLP